MRQVAAAPLSINCRVQSQKNGEAGREANVKNGVDETRILSEDGRRYSYRIPITYPSSFTHRRLTVLVDVALLGVVGAAEGAALVELDEHRVRGVPGAVDVDAVLVVRVAYEENMGWT